MRHLLEAAAAAAASVLAVQASGLQAASRGDVLYAVDVLALPYASRTEAVLVRRQAGSPAVLASAAAAASTNETDDPKMYMPNGKLNVTEWDVQTDAACKKALGGLRRSTNPSGNCICYNLPSLDTTTGDFEADLRLYRVSDPRDNFANVKESDISVGLSYNGASVSPISKEQLAGMGMTQKNDSQPAVTKRDTAGEPKLLQLYMFVGRIDKGNMDENMTLSTLENYLMPVFTLTAKKPDGGTASTNLSLNEASFLTGVFSKQVIVSDFKAAQVAVDAKVQAMKNGTVAFVLPGVQLMIFPIGLIITSIWLLLGVVAYGFGTYERSVYAEMYKRRVHSLMVNRGKTI